MTKIKKISAIIAVAFLIFIGFLLWNTYRKTSRQLLGTKARAYHNDTTALNRLSKAIQCTTNSYENRIDTAAFEALHRLLDTAYQNCKQHTELTRINQYGLLYKIVGKNTALKPVVLMAHQDVVPVEGESLQQWTVPPYSGIIRGGFVWGRGTLDDKMSITAILEACEQLFKEGWQPQRTLYLAFGQDEEVGGERGAKAIAAHLQKQGVKAEWVLDEGLVVLEKALPGLQQPVAMIGIAEKGFATLKLNVKLAKGGHSSMPPKETAIGILSKGIAKLEENQLPNRFSEPIKLLLDFTAPEMEQPYRTIFSNKELFGGLLKTQFAAKPSSAAMLHTTTAVTMIQSGVKDNVLPTVAEATVNFRISPNDNTKIVRQHVLSVIDDERIAVGMPLPGYSEPSRISQHENEAFALLHKSIKTIYPNTVVAPMLVIALTDSRHFSDIAENVYRFIPVQLTNDDLSRIHGIDERISVDNYFRCIRFYDELLRNL